MPRYYKYRRSYVKKVYPRKRWCSNIKSATLNIVLRNTGTSAHDTYLVCANSPVGSTPNPVILKFARFKLKGDVRFSSPTANGPNIDITPGKYDIYFNDITGQIFFIKR